MLTTACLTVTPSKIAHNVRQAIDICGRFGMEVVGITKGACGLPEAAQAMLDGGAKMLGDSRLDNIARMRQAGIDAPVLLVRSPAKASPRTRFPTCAGRW